MLEGNGFQDLLNVLDPRYKPVSRATLLERHIVPMYQHTRQQVASDIAKGVRHAFTTDAWTSSATQSFLTCTVHYIDPESITLESRVLDTTHCPESHTAETLAREMQVSVKTWNLKNPVAVSDNAANIQKACQLCEYPHFGCFAHTLNLCVKKGINIPEISRVVGKCRKLVAFFKQSDLKTTKLIQAEKVLDLKELALQQDVETRWNSTVYMMRRITQVYPAVHKVVYEASAKHLLLDMHEISVVESMIKVLEPFEKLTVKISSEKKPTCGFILPALHLLKNRDLVVNDTDSGAITKMKNAMKEDLKKRYLTGKQGLIFSNCITVFLFQVYQFVNYLFALTSSGEQDLLCLASAVDPRFKDLNWLSADEREKTFERVFEEAMSVAKTPLLPSMVRVKVEPEESDMPSFSQTQCTTVSGPPLPNLPEDFVQSLDPLVPQPSAPKPSSPKPSASKLEDDFFYDEVILVKVEEGPVSVEDKVRLEMTRFKAEPRCPLDCHPMDWWKDRMGSYPYLVKVAIRYLMIPATSVPSERVFSAAGNIVSKKRCSLSASNINMMIFLHANFKKCSKLNVQ